MKTLTQNVYGLLQMFAAWMRQPTIIEVAAEVMVEPQTQQ